MASAQSRLDILISAKNDSSPQIKAISADLKSLDSAADAAAGGLSGLAGAAGIAGFTALAGAIGSAAFELGEMGAQALQVESSFAGMAGRIGASASEMMDVMHAASQGMISDQELMLGANRALLGGVATNVEELGALIEVAGERAAIMGTNTADAFSDLVRGIATMQADLIDNLGIATGGKKVFDDYAASLHKSADELTDVERKQALLNLAIKDTLPYLNDNIIAGDNAAGSFQRLDAATDNLKTSFGEMMAVGLAPWLDWVTEKAQALAFAMNVIKGGKPLSFGHAPTTDVMGIHTEQTTYAQQALAKATEETNAALGQQGADMTDLNKAYDAANRSIAHMASAQLDTLGAQGVLGVQQDLTAELGNQVRIWQDMRIDPEQIANVLIPGWLDQQRGITKEMEATGRATSQVNTEYNDLLGKVKGVVKGALDPGVNVDPSDLLPRQDAVNEDARRLADVAVNGWASPWAEYFRTAFPDEFLEMASSSDINQGAALMLRNFQDGLEPELINKDVAKERVRKMLIGDANMRELTSEIAGELASEMGIPLSEAMQAAQGTLGGGMGAGGEMARQFGETALAQVETDSTGGTIVDTTISQMRARYSLLSVAGQDAAKAWGEGFVNYAAEHVPAALISILADLVTPAIQARFTQQATLQGAVP